MASQPVLAVSHWLQELCYKLRRGTTTTSPETDEDAVEEILTMLDFQGQTFGTQTDVNAFCAALQSNTTLLELVLSFSLRHLENSSISTSALTLKHQLAQSVLFHHSSLQRLYLLNNGLDDSFVRLMAAQLMPSTSSSSTTNSTCRLTHLYLDGNNIGDNGVVALSEMLVHNHSLTWLSLSCNRIRDRGCIALARALVQLPMGKNIKKSRLETLGLGANRITSVGASALERALDLSPAASMLKIVRIKNNHHDDDSNDDDDDSNKTSFSKQECEAHQLRLDAILKNNHRIQSNFEQFEQEQHEMISNNSKIGIIPRALERFAKKPDLMFAIVRSQPDLFLHYYSHNTNNNSEQGRGRAGIKRVRDDKSSTRLLLAA